MADEVYVYFPASAARVTHYNLPGELRSKFTVDEVDEVLHKNFRWEQKDKAYNLESERINYIISECRIDRIDVNEQEVYAILEAEEEYLKMIKVM